MNEKEQTGRASEPADLRARICDVNVPKTEAEWWAQAEIARQAAELARLRARVAELEKSEARWREKYMALHLRACMVMRLDSFDSIIRNSLSDDDEQWTDFERAAFKATNAAFSAIEAAVYWKAVAEGEADIRARVAELEGENTRFLLWIRQADTYLVHCMRQEARTVLAQALGGSDGR